MGEPWSVFAVSERGSTDGASLEATSGARSPSAYGRDCWVTQRGQLNATARLTQSRNSACKRGRASERRTKATPRPGRSVRNSQPSSRTPASETHPKANGPGARNARVAAPHRDRPARDGNTQGRLRQTPANDNRLSKATIRPTRSTP